jgi:hypothetical protein
VHGMMARSLPDARAGNKGVNFPRDLFLGAITPAHSLLFGVPRP